MGALKAAEAAAMPRWLLWPSIQVPRMSMLPVKSMRPMDLRLPAPTPAARAGSTAQQGTMTWKPSSVRWMVPSAVPVEIWQPPSAPTGRAMDWMTLPEVRSISSKKASRAVVVWGLVPLPTRRARRELAPKACGVVGAEHRRGELVGSGVRETGVIVEEGEAVWLLEGEGSAPGEPEAVAEGVGRTGGKATARRSEKALAAPAT